MSKIYVGLSGGVDSSVAAALLKNQGHEVVGVFMKNWSHDVGGHHCPWQEDLASARSVAAHLQIPLKVFDFEKEYFESVASHMIETYKSGLTPNPDIMCNSEIKFKLYLRKCLDNGAEYIATGHYAKMDRGNLKVAKDSNKDQTYFLYRIDPEVAEKILFPIGEYTKPKVRELAAKFNLPTAKRPDSQGLCFVGPVPMRDFLREFIKPQKGDIVDESGKKIGEHGGAFYYTIGQRHGLGIGGGQPYFVYKIDTKANLVYVTTDEHSLLLNHDEFTISDCVWWQEPEIGKEYGIRVRYRSALKPGKITTIKDGKFEIKLDSRERAIAPGQSAVLYDGYVVVGGGIIESLQ